MKEFIYNSTYDIYGENEPCLEGYGIAWKKHGGGGGSAAAEWQTYKSHIPYYTDKHYKTVLNRAENAPCILAHVRREVPHFTNHRTPASYDNTHPFQYGQHVLIHNGYIFRFARHRKMILSHIDKKYHSKIRGDTDTEYLFYLYLTFCNEETNDSNAAMKAWNRIFQFFRDKKIHAKINIIYTNNNFAVIARYVVLGRAEIIDFCKECTTDPLPLYIEENGTGELLISSRPLSDKQKSIEKNVILLRKL